MEMLERCPGCSVTREVEPAKAVAGSRPSRPCANCGYDGVFSPLEAGARVSPRDSLPSFAGARANLATATRDLFRLSGNYSIPVEAPAPEPAPPPSAPVSSSLDSGRKPEASIMFSLEALMKTAAPTPPPPAAAQEDQMSGQLWDMQAATPLFGTSDDQALLTTPLKMEPAQSMDSMTLPSHTPSARRWLPIFVAATAGLALAGAGIWFFGGSQGTPTVNAATPPQAPTSLTAPPSEAPASDAPAADSLANAAQLPAEPSEPAPAAVAEQPAPDSAAPSAEATPPEPAPAAGEPAVSPPKSTGAKDKTPVKKPPPRAVASAASAKAAFDKGAAKTALNTAASQAAGCGAGGAPGKGKIQVTFAPSGKVSDAQLVEGPFGATAAGKCALRHFRAAKVPAFSGAPVTVAKSFKVD